MPKHKLSRSATTLILKRSKRVAATSRNTNEASFKIRFTYSVTSDGSGIVADFLSTSDPELAGNGSGTYNDWANLEALYDSYRVDSLSLNYSPYYPHGGTAARSQAPCFVVQDNDDVTAPGSIDELLQYDKVAIRPLDKPWSLFYKVPRMASNQNPVGWLNIGNAGSQNFSCVKLYASGLTVSTSYGRMVLTMRITCRGRR